MTYLVVGQPASTTVNEEGSDPDSAHTDAGTGAALRDDLDVDFALVLHGGSFGDGSQRVGDASLLADHFTQVARGDAHFVSRGLFLRHFGDAHLIRLVYERFHQILN